MLNDFANNPAELTPAELSIVEALANHADAWLPDQDQLAALVTEYADARTKLLTQLKPVSRLAPAIFDAGAEDQALFIRGNPETTGDAVPRRLLTAIAGEQPLIEHGSGRLQLARRTLASPLAARVMVNRIWHHLMGRGIVPSVDNFGVLGQKPTHPELLDHLAGRFANNGWSIKQMIRSIMLSRTYQMSSMPDPRNEQLDPTNQLLHRAGLRRLDAEAIRDSILSMSGRLEPAMFGPSIPLHLTPFMEGRGRPEKDGPVDGDGRRSIYLAIRRNFLSPMMLAFDRPQPSAPAGRRTVSNVPAQALILLNDPFVIEQAKLWADRLLGECDHDEARLQRLYNEAFARPPTPEEQAASMAFVQKQARAHEGDGQHKAWADLCHVIINAKEFIFLR